MTTFPTTWKDHLRLERVQRNWRQVDLAEALGTSVVTVQRWEKGNQLPSVYFRARLCSLFGKSAEELGLVDLPLLAASPAAEELTEASSPAGEHLALWNVPYMRNPHFTGREDLLQQFRERLHPRSPEEQRSTHQVVQIQALTGLGGIGKTQTAVEYAYRVLEQGLFRHILWLNAASQETVLASFVALARLLPTYDALHETDQQKMVVAVKRWLEESTQPWLLIIDNADDLSLIKEHIPQRGPGSVLLTTRAHAVGALALSVEVEALGWVEGMQFLLSRTQRNTSSDQEKDDAMNVVMALEAFPLALDQAGAYIEETGCSFAEYLQLYRQHRQALLARRGKQASAYPDSVATTWALSFEKVKQASPAAGALLQLLAFLAPDRIPEELLCDGADCWSEALQQSVTDLLAFNQMVEALLAFSLVKRLAEERFLSMHRLVQTVQRDAISIPEQREWAIRVVRGVHAIFPVDPKGDVASWPLCLRYLEQAQACDELIQHYHLQMPEAADVLNRAGRYLHTHASYSLAEPLYMRALQIREQQSGSEHLEVGRSLNSLAYLSKEMGKYTEAEQFYQRALSICEQQVEPAYPELVSALSGLALLYKDQGKYTKAEPLYQRALQMAEQQLGPEHLQIASLLSNLTVFYREQGKYTEAELFSLRSLRIREKQQGPEHPDIAYALTNLAIVYNALGKYEEVEPLYRRALAIREQHLGPHHPELARPLYNLALFYTAREKYKEAEPLCLQALQILERQLEPAHPDLAYPLYGLANIYLKQGKDAEAEPLFQQTLQILEQRFGVDHPRLTYSLNGLASICHRRGNDAEAARLYERSLSIGTLVNSPDTAETLESFAALREAQGKLREAASLYQRALELRERVSGPEHHQTLATHARLQTVLVSLTGEESEQGAENKSEQTIGNDMLKQQRPSIWR